MGGGFKNWEPSLSYLENEIFKSMSKVTNRLPYEIERC